ncbi:hypothetical protein ROV86_14455 [Stenotrophomonas pavanii]|uniref:hypothetical protein n=1 Tax=Stenotrophomonas pavanii TaxID=487698 RepID=UPI0028938CC1|nr:hypothetical protein [Stenotrophomonas pavanii]MDT3529297.1 hypothetical protein [Stenotrophomonas pavanii]
MTKLGFELIGFTEQNSDAVKKEISRIPELGKQQYVTSLHGATIGYFEVQEYNGDREELLEKLKDALEPYGVDVKGGDAQIPMDLRSLAKDQFIDKPR